MLVLACVYAVVISWLRFIFRSQKKQMLRSAYVNGPLAMAGFGLLAYTVSIRQWPAIWSNLLIAALMWPLGFALNRLVVWPDPETDSSDGSLRWVLKSGGFAGVSHSSYLLFVWAGAPYLVVKAGLILVLGPASYLFHAFWVFNRQCGRTALGQKLARWSATIATVAVVAVTSWTLNSRLKTEPV